MWSSISHQTYNVLLGWSILVKYRPICELSINKGFPLALWLHGVPKYTNCFCQYRRGGEHAFLHLAEIDEKKNWCIWEPIGVQSGRPLLMLSSHTQKMDQPIWTKSKNSWVICWATLRWLHFPDLFHQLVQSPQWSFLLGDFCMSAPLRIYKIQYIRWTDICTGLQCIPSFHNINGSFLSGYLVVLGRTGRGTSIDPLPVD